MHSTSSNSAKSHVGTIEPGARGPILRDDDGVCWRHAFVDESAAEGLSGQVRVRGRIVDVDRIEVEYVEVQADANALDQHSESAESLILRPPAFHLFLKTQLRLRLLHLHRQGYRQ